MITPASSNSEQPYLNTEPPVAAEPTATTATTTATAETAPPAELKEELSSTLKMAEALPTTPAWSQNIVQIMTVITKLIAMILELMKLRQTPEPTPPALPKPPDTGAPPTCPGPPTQPAPPEVPASPIKKPIEQGSPLGRSAGFLWKPVSDKNAKLAILLPPGLSGQVEEVVILSPDGKRTLQRGKYSGVGNGDREHYRFSKAGGEFPDGSIVVIKLKDGTTKHMVIKETSARLEKR